MSSVVDFLEKMGSEAHWRYASTDDIKAALMDTGIDTPMCAAILARNTDEVQALLGRVTMMPTQMGNPGIPPHIPPHEVPKPPQPVPGEPEEEEEHDDSTGGKHKPPKGACGSLSFSSPSSQ
jgi:hypothetical protein